MLVVIEYIDTFFYYTKKTLKVGFFVVSLP